MLSLPDDWDYTLQGLAQINKESIDAIREAVRELERAGYIERSRERDERGCLRGKNRRFNPLFTRERNAASFCVLICDSIFRHNVHRPVLHLVV